jgi:hypothetical protein
LVQKRKALEGRCDKGWRVKAGGKRRELKEKEKESGTRIKE